MLFQEQLLICQNLMNGLKINFKDEKNCGLICLKEGDLNEELIPFKNRAKIYNIF